MVDPSWRCGGVKVRRRAVPTMEQPTRCRVGKGHSVSGESVRLGFIMAGRCLEDAIRPTDRLGIQAWNASFVKA